MDQGLAVKIRCPMRSWYQRTKYFFFLKSRQRRTSIASIETLIYMDNRYVKCKFSYDLWYVILKCYCHPNFQISAYLYFRQRNLLLWFDFLCLYKNVTVKELGCPTSYSCHEVFGIFIFEVRIRSSRILKFKVRICSNRIFVHI